MLLHYIKMPALRLLDLEEGEVFEDRPAELEGGMGSSNQDI